jgi:hypothetical protein
LSQLLFYALRLTTKSIQVMQKYLILGVFLFSLNNVNASHLISNEITYEYLGDSNYLIRIEKVDWCGGTIWNAANPPIPNAVPVLVYNKANIQQGGAINIPLRTIDTYKVFSWSGSAYNSCGTSGNNGYTGYEVGTYDTVVNIGVFVGNCDSVRISFNSGARITSTNGYGQPSYYTFCDIDMANPYQNSSVKLFKFDIPASFVDSSFYTFSVAMFDVDGDSLTYSLNDAWVAYNSTLNALQSFTYASGYSSSQPINNINLDSLNGQMSFPAKIPLGNDYANYVLNIKTMEWDPGSGDLIQETYRDVQLFVLPFPGNNNPLFLGLDNPQHAKQTDSLRLRVCVGDTFSFDVTFDDPDLTDTLFVTSNLEFIADYYSVTQTGINPTTATLNAVINKEYEYGIDIIVKAMDSHNPMIGQTSRAVRIRSIGSTNQTLLGCYSAWDTVMTQADSFSTWSVLNGDSLSTQTFNCLNGTCNMAEVNPFNSTTYLIENYMTGNCSFTDTIMVLTDPTILIGQALDTSQNPVISSKVYRFQYDSGQDSVYVLDSTTTDAAGFFTFSLGIDSFLLKVSPDINTYPLLLPTYYDSKLTVAQADFIYPDYCDTLELTHEVQSGVNLGGPGFIAGIVSQGAGRAVGDPVPGVDIVLMSDEETPIAHTKTDVNGEFRFDDLSNGDYLVYLDRWLIQNNLAPMITLTEEYNEVDDLEFILYSNRLELVKPSSVDGIEQERIEIFPNPTTEQITVMGDALFTSIRIVDILGAVNGTFQVNSDQSSINLSDLPDGVYFVEVFNGQELIEQQRVVLMK